MVEWSCITRGCQSNTDELAQQSLGTTTIGEQAQVYGEHLLAYQEVQQQHTRVERTRWNDQHYDPFLKRCISIDDGKVHLSGEGWKEFKAGLVCDFECQWQRTNQLFDFLIHTIQQ